MAQRLGFGLVDDELDQRGGIEVDGQGALCVAASRRLRAALGGERRRPWSARTELDRRDVE
jgi:hypothetical protein